MKCFTCFFSNSGLRYLREKIQNAMKKPKVPKSYMHKTTHIFDSSKLVLQKQITNYRITAW